MSIVETALVFVGIPALIVAVLALLVYGRSQFKGPNRYRPGKPWNYALLWYLPHPTADASAPTGHPVLESGEAARQRAVKQSAVGGASGEW
jgi:hypothetical protein